MNELMGVNEDKSKSGENDENKGSNQNLYGVLPILKNHQNRMPKQTLSKHFTLL